MSEFRFYYKGEDGNFVLADSFTPLNPYGGGALQNELEYTKVFSEAITSQRFRAEFVQYGPKSNASGVTVIELDGFGEALPTSEITESNSDLWQYTDIEIISHSPILARHGTTFDIRNMFGGVFADYEDEGGVADGHTVFADDQQPGYPHEVVWRTQSPVRLESFSLFAQHDGHKTFPNSSIPRYAHARGFSEFELFAKNESTGTFDLVYSYTPSNPYGGGELLNELAIQRTLPQPVEAQEFKAIFYQYGRVNDTSGGPAVVELDGFGEAKSGGNSNVLFLPGFQGSRLYKQGNSFEDQLWLPTRNQDAEQLYLRDDGTPVDPTIYTRDIIDESHGFGLNIYKGFMNFMDTEMVGAGVINQWHPYAYDWRKPIDEIAGEANLIQAVNELASTSQNGKVAIIAHSMGGNIAKLLLTNPNIAGKVDKLILVATPQLGTPHAIGGLLHGANQGIPFVLSQQTARTLGENMLSAYSLLPSAAYFNEVADPVITFSEDIADSHDFRALYGESIDTFTEFTSFMTGDGGTRSEPIDLNTLTPNVLDVNLFNRSKNTTDVLTSWIPPEGVKVTQIAGWGLDTIYQFEYSPLSCDFCDTQDGEFPLLNVEPKFTIDGDKTVVALSAKNELLNNVNSYYLNIRSSNLGQVIPNSHATVMEISSLQRLISMVIDTGDSLPAFITQEIPNADTGNAYRLRMKSPVEVHVYDSQGRHVGLNKNNNTELVEYDEEIPNSSYFQIEEKKYISLDGNDMYTVKLRGEGSGIFTFEIDEVQGDIPVKTFSYNTIPTTGNLIGELIINPDSEDSPQLQLDVNGDGTVDAEVTDGETLSSEAGLVLLEQAIQNTGMSEKEQKRLLQYIDKTMKKMAKERDTRAIKKLEDLGKKVDEMVKKQALSEQEAISLRQIVASIINAF